MRALFALLLLAGCEAPCGSDGDCAWDEICHVSQCERALDRTWEVRLERASVAVAHPDGFAWDFDGSPPDLLAEAGTADEICQTSTVWDDYTPTWAESCWLHLETGGWLVVDVWDQDDSLDEYVTGFLWEGEQDLLNLARSRDRWLRLRDPTDTVWVELWLSPAH